MLYGSGSFTEFSIPVEAFLWLAGLAAPLLIIFAPERKGIFQTIALQHATSQDFDGYLDKYSDTVAGRRSIRIEFRLMKPLMQRSHSHHH